MKRAKSLRKDGRGDGARSIESEMVTFRMPSPLSAYTGPGWTSEETDITWT